MTRREGGGGGEGEDSVYVGALPSGVIVFISTITFSKFVVPE